MTVPKTVLMDLMKVPVDVRTRLTVRTENQGPMDSHALAAD